MTHTKAGAAFTDLVLEIFRSHGRLLAAGDRLGKPLDLTSARWQVLGAVEQKPLPVAQIGRNMGLARQSVQRVADALADDGLIRYQPNPDHRRAKLVCLTEAGRKAAKRIWSLQVEWANSISSGVSAEEISKAVALIRRLSQRIH
jgi:DNA-binding MarR family transcriptional regulator